MRDPPFDRRLFRPPISLEILRCGPRYGWRGTNTHSRGHCDINWFDVKPRPVDNGYDDYVRDVAVLMNGRTSFYRGFLVPPSPEEHLRMCMNEYGKRVREVG